jgi:hypothetical protein
MKTRMLASALAVLLCSLGARALENDCTNHLDDDGDSVVDCADADCYREAACAAGKGDENTEATCSDFVDNDGDTFVDCDDPDCEPFQTCKGSWKGGDVTPAPKSALAAGADPMSLIGTDGDLDGERNNDVCADGIDNDGDGRTDCQDFGCRYDPGVTVCQQTGGTRFSVVVGMQQSHLSKTVGTNPTEVSDTTSIQRLQLRALGAIPTLSNSFYLLSLRAERTTRMTFAMFQIPVGTKGHYVNLNTGSGGLSSALVTSAANQLFFDPPAYVYKAFEQGNGAALETGGPLLSDSRRYFYRVFAAGGSGKTTGNIGGSYYANADRNFNWSLGTQLQANIVGGFSRLDSPFLYTPVATTVGLLAGVKFDQRDDERYPAFNGRFVARSGRYLLQAENYSKYELNFGSFQTAYVLQAGFLAVPKLLMFAADFGQFRAGAFAKATDAAKPQDEWQARAAAHFFVWRNIGLLSAVYRERHQAPKAGELKENVERQLFGELQFRF